MHIQTVGFSEAFLDQAAVLVYQAQVREFESKKMKHVVTQEFCREQIEAELSKGSSSAYMIIDNQDLAGFAIGVIKRDSVWGDSGWVNLGGWGIADGRTDLLAYLYQRIGEDFVEQNIIQHCFQVWASDGAVLESMNNLGFAKEQTYACLELLHKPEFRLESPLLSVRRFGSSDKIGLSEFSRLIAGYQMKSPCFAAAPEAYLEALDEGFNELSDDPEAEIFVAEQDGRLVGFQVYFKAAASLIVAPESVELAVAGVAEEYRGQGAGRALTAFALDAQLKAGYSYAVTDWRCANLLSSKFWKDAGFIPSLYRLSRRIDPLLIS